MKKRNWILAVIAAVALAAMPLAYAQQSHGHHMRGEGGFGMFLGHLGKAKAALNLSDTQVDQLKSIAQQLRTQNAPYRDQLKGGRQAVAQLLLADPNNVAGARALLDKQDAVKHSIEVNTLQAASKALNVLTPEQRTKVATFLEQRAARGSQRGMDGMGQHGMGQSGR